MTKQNQYDPPELPEDIPTPEPIEQSPPSMLWYPNDWLSSSLLTVNPSLYPHVWEKIIVGYFNLLNELWVSKTCSLPYDEKQLSALSRLGRKWKKVREPILEKFHHRDGRLYNIKLLSKWEPAVSKYRGQCRGAHSSTSQDYSQDQSQEPVSRPDLRQPLRPVSRPSPITITKTNNKYLTDIDIIKEAYKDGGYIRVQSLGKCPVCHNEDGFFRYRHAQGKYPNVFACDECNHFDVVGMPNPNKKPEGKTT